MKLQYILFMFAVLTSFSFGFGEKKVLSKEEYNQKAEKRMKAFKKPKNLKIELFADESQVKNPSAFYFDSKGRLLVCEIHRWRQGVDDIRNRPYMLFEDIAIQTNADRLKMFKNHIDKHPMEHYTKKEDTIRILEDLDDDGRVDRSRIFAGGFNDALDGPGIGIIERDGKYYYTNIPHLWMLEDTDGDGISDKRSSLQDGFGTRMSFSGHDMHGLVWGPDGKLYWSIGDRGFSVKTKEGKLFHSPNEGAVFRCDPDGSNVELFYDRLRNPQELAFDDYGNLFTADNDGDRSDQERINYIVEGGDSGWHAGHQALMTFTRRYNFRSYKYTNEELLNAWEHELMWKVRSKEQPAFLLPGIGQIVGGPSGFAFNPSNSMGKEYDDKFFVIHYRGTLNKSNITTFSIAKDGAGFKTKNHKVFFSGSNCVDIDFGPDGKLYISDYNYGGWFNQDVGNIYAMYIPGEIDKPEVLANKKTLLSDFSKFSTKELDLLLERDHRDVRQRAQFELAKRSGDGANAFLSIAKNTTDSTLKRLHAIWGLGMMANQKPELLKTVLTCLDDKDEHVRTQAARVLGDHRYQNATDKLIEKLKDSNSQTAMYAAIGLGRIGADKAVGPLMELVRHNNNKDLFLRHGAIMGLAGVSNKDIYLKYQKDESSSVRVAVLLALRRSKDPRIANFLKDKDQSIVYEAIRAVNDLQIVDEKAQEELASMLNSLPVPMNNVDSLMHYRVINANFYGGKKRHADRLLQYAANKSIPERQRRDALAAIEGWNDKHPLDPTTGLPRLDNAKRDDIEDSIHKHLAGILKGSIGKHLAQSLRLSGKVSYTIPNGLLIEQARNPKIDENVRVESLAKLEAQNYSDILKFSQTLLKDSKISVIEKAMQVILKLNPKLGVEQSSLLTQRKKLSERQLGFRLLTGRKEEKVHDLLADQLSAVINQKVDQGIQLDILEAARKTESSKLSALLKNYDEKMKPKTVMERFSMCEEGGDAAKGSVVFYNHAAGQCIRCHKIYRTGANVGPNLTTIGSHYDRRYLLEAIVDPGATVALGFATVSLTLKNGKSVAGTLTKETKNKLHFTLADGKKITVLTKDIVSREKPISGMPPMHFLLKPEEIRDLVAFLSTQVDRKKGKFKKKKVSDSH